MQNNETDSFRTQESAFKQFRRSCLGRIVTLVVVLAVLLVVAWLTNPSTKRMKDEMWDNIRQSLEADGPADLDGSDVFVNNISYTFSTAEGEENKELMDFFRQNNTLDFEDHGIFSTMTLHYLPGAYEECCGLGIFGMVIPTANFKRFLPQDAPRGEYNERLINTTTNEEEDLGTTPVDIFRYEGE